MTDPVNNKPLVLAARHLRREFNDGKLSVDVLKDINLEVFAGDMVAIIGSSGSGKSTLLHQLGGLDLPSSGEIEVCGKNLAKLSDTGRGKLRNNSLGFIYQFHHLLPEFTALENVSMPLMIGGKSPAEAAAIANELLVKVGLGDRVEHKPSELSGGERQRTAIARALANKPDVVLADEPTGNLDSKTANKIYQQMLQLNEELDTAFVLVTHDQQLAALMHKVYSLEEGQLVRHK